MKSEEYKRKELLKKGVTPEKLKHILEEDKEVSLVAIKVGNRADIYERCSQHLKEGHKYMQQGEYETATTYFQLALEGYKDVLKINSKLAGYKKAKQILKTDFTNDRPAIRGIAEAWRSKGVALEKLGKHRESSKCYEKALKIEPNLIKDEIIAMIDEALEE